MPKIKEASIINNPITLEQLELWKQNFYGHFIDTDEGIEVTDYAVLINIEE